MPLPLIPIAIIATSSLATVFGIYKGWEWWDKTDKAESINKEAEGILDDARIKTATTFNESEKNLEELGRAKLDVLDKSMNRFVTVFEKIHSIELTDSAGMNELRKYRIDKHSVFKLREMSTLAAEAVSGLAGGTVAGALTAFGAYGATMTFASASTGTAIATLSGIAAKNATLAFLGGGAIAVGGGGMALGAMVLGGIVLGPAMVVMGIVMDASAQKNLEVALSNKVEAEKMAEELNLIKLRCRGIAARAEMFNILLKKLNETFVTLIGQLEYIVSIKGTDYTQYSEAEQNRVAMAMSVAGAVKKVLDTPILNDSGGVTEESWETNIEMRTFFENVQSALNCPNPQAASVKIL